MYAEFKHGECDAEVYLLAQIQKVCLYDRKTDKRLPVGWMYVQAGNKKLCVIDHIQVRPQYRKKGYGKQLIEILQKYYDKIITDFEAEILDSPSTKLLVKCGFVIVPQFDKKDVGRLVWKKK